jgi:hypothetical protein
MVAGFSATAIFVAIATSGGCGGSSNESTTPRHATTATSPGGQEPPPAAAVAESVNSKGLRATREIDYAKPNGRMRIVCVGGATTFGDGVAVDATYPAWIQKNMRGRAYDVEVLNAGKPGRGAAESAVLLETELLKYEPDLVVVSVQKDEGTATTADLQRIEALLKARRIVYVLLVVPEFADHPARLVETFAKDGYQPKQPSVYLVPAKAALDAYIGKEPLFDTTGHWTADAHKRMGNSLAEMIVGIPLICCAKGQVTPEP